MTIAHHALSCLLGNECTREDTGTPLVPQKAVHVQSIASWLFFGMASLCNVECSHKWNLVFSNCNRYNGRQQLLYSQPINCILCNVLFNVNCIPYSLQHIVLLDLPGCKCKLALSCSALCWPPSLPCTTPLHRSMHCPLHLKTTPTLQCDSNSLEIRVELTVN